MGPQRTKIGHTVMEPTDDGARLRQAFFAALEERRLETCARLLQELDELAARQPALRCWGDYFAGIIANERDQDWAAAERRFRRIITSDCEPGLRFRARLALGRALDYQGRWDEAIAVFTEYLQAATALNEPLEQAKAWKHLAISTQKGYVRGAFPAQDLAQAVAYCRLALAALAGVSPQTPPVEWLAGTVWNTLGVVSMSLGDLDQARDCYERDLRICRAQRDRFGMALSHHNLGEIAGQRGPASWGEALGHYRHALRLVRRLEQPEPYEEVDILANIGFLYQQMGRRRLALRYYRRAIERIEQIRTRTPDAEARAGFFATTVDIYALMVLLCVELNEHAAAFTYVERARARAFLDTLLGAEGDASAAAEPLDCRSVQAALPEGALLLAYFTTGLVDSRAVGRAARYRFPPERTLIFAVTGAHIQVIDAGISPNDLRPAYLDDVVGRHFLDPTMLMALHRQLIAPVEPLLPGARRLYIIPHGPLHYIPFAALIAADGERLLRDDGPQLLCSPSASLLFTRQAGGGEARDAGCLALGYNGEGHNQLALAEEEAESVVRLTGGHAIVGRAPKAEALFERGPHYRLLHLSCHGLFNHDAPLESALFLAPGERLTALDMLGRLRLRADLVTLSACESGLSQVRRGDELIGLVRAVVQAGARSVIVSLWRVDELATRLLMGALYRELVGGAEPALALKRAQLALRRTTRAQAHVTLTGIATRSLLHLDHQPPPLALHSGGWAAPEPPRPNPAPLEGAGLSASQDAQSRPHLLGGEGGRGATADDDLPFDSPYYWAAFVVIGGA